MSHSLKENLSVLLSEHKPSEVVAVLSVICAERAKKLVSNPPRVCGGCGSCAECKTADERIGWQETTAALDSALNQITGYGL